MNLRFPTKQNNHDLYFVQFDVYELEKIDINIEGNGENFTSSLVRGAQSSFNYDKKAEKLLDSITLPLQTTVTENTAASFSEKSTKKLSRIVQGLTGTQQGDMSGFFNAALGGLVESAAGKVGEDIKDAALGGLGKAINEQMQVIYEGPQRRKFSMEFTLVARNLSDAEQMQKIRKRLHYHASPSTSNSGTFFNYPNMVRFRFLRRSLDDPNTISRLESLFESKYCYIESVNVEHGDGIFSEFIDTNNEVATGIMKITLELQEAEYMLKDDFWSEDDDA